VVEHLKNGKGQNESGYPESITSLPEAYMPFENAKGWILQSDNSQLLFFEFTKEANLPEHSHSYSQWGMVIEGKMELMISGKPRVYGKGDEYLIPAGAKHRAKFLTTTRVMDLFSEKTRYTRKRVKSSF
jgi:quercetin dioxygenase-like cupin family protein